MTGRRTTIYDLAELSGTSASAVASVLNGTWKRRRIAEKTAARVLALAEEHGYARNIQASVLRRARSNMVGMVIPKYDNRYFGAIAERFERTARQRGLFPIITCTQRDPDLEVQAARELVSYQVDAIIATGATDPDRVTAICRAAGVRSVNLDLSGTATASVVSDNRAGARDLAERLLTRCRADLGYTEPLLFIGGRAQDSNTRARIAGFIDAHEAAGIDVPADFVLTSGYDGAKAEAALRAFPHKVPTGLFVNSTISLEGVIRWLIGTGRMSADRIRFGAFDWDPFAALLPGNVGMVRQDVDSMVEKAFHLLAEEEDAAEVHLIPCILDDHAVV